MCLHAGEVCCSGLVWADIDICFSFELKWKWKRKGPSTIIHCQCKQLLANWHHQPLVAEMGGISMLSVVWQRCRCRGDIAGWLWPRKYPLQTTKPSKGLE